MTEAFVGLPHPGARQDAAVPIYYERRPAKLVLDEAERPKIDPGLREGHRGKEVKRKEELTSKWAHPLLSAEWAPA